MSENHSLLRVVTNAFRPVVVLLHAYVGLTFACTQGSPMPFGLLWCCYLQLPSPDRIGHRQSPMPFGLLWCCYPKVTAIQFIA